MDGILTFRVQYEWTVSQLGLESVNLQMVFNFQFLLEAARGTLAITIRLQKKTAGK